MKIIKDKKKIKEKSIKKINQNDKKKVLKITIIIVCIIIFIYLLVLLVKLIKKPTNTFVVENGKIYQGESADGYVIRDENLINIDLNESSIVKIKSESEKVAKGEPIFRYSTANEDEINKKIAEVDLKIQENLTSNNNEYFSTDIKLINNKIDEKLKELYKTNDMQKILQGTEEINDNLTKKVKIEAQNSNNNDLKNLVNQRKTYEEQLESNAKYLKAEQSGVISYRIDGLENSLKNGDFSYLNEDFLKKLNLQTGQIIASSTNSGKIVNNFQCNIACILKSNEAKNAKVGDYLKLRLQSSDEITAKIVYKKDESDNKTLLVFEINQDVDSLIKYRKISLDVIWWSNSGLKIPNSAIKYEGNFAYVIRNRAGLKEKIIVKVLRSNDKYSIVENYSYAELQEAGYDTSSIINKKSISIYDEVEVTN